MKCYTIVLSLIISILQGIDKADDDKEYKRNYHQHNYHSSNSGGNLRFEWVASVCWVLSVAIYFRVSVALDFRVSVAICFV